MQISTHPLSRTSKRGSHRVRWTWRVLILSLCVTDSRTQILVARPFPSLLQVSSSVPFPLKDKLRSMATLFPAGCFSRCDSWRLCWGPWFPMWVNPNACLFTVLWVFTSLRFTTLRICSLALYLLFIALYGIHHICIYICCCGIFCLVGWEFLEISPLPRLEYTHRM